MISLSVITQIVSCYLNGYWKQYVVNIQGERKEYVKKKKKQIFIYLLIFKYGSFIYYDGEILFTLMVTQCFAESQ